MGEEIYAITSWMRCESFKLSAFANPLRSLDLIYAPSFLGSFGVFGEAAINELNIIMDSS
jgi:hypothetical protein